MKKSVRLVLRLVSLLDYLLLSYPLLAIAEASISRRLTGAQSLTRLGLILAIGLLGGLVGGLLDRWSAPLPPILLLLLAAVPAAVFAAAFAFLAPWDLIHAVLLVLCLLFYGLGMFSVTKPFDEIVNTGFLSVGLVAYIVAEATLWFCAAYYGLPCDPMPLLGVFLVFILFYAIISNQSNIHRLMNRGHADLSMLPAGMLRYNLLLLLCGFGLILCGLFLQKPILVVIQFLGRLLLSILYFFVLFFRLWLWLLQSPADQATPPSVGALPLFGSGEEHASTPYVNAVIQWVAVASIVLMVFLCRRWIWETVQNAWRKLVQLLKRLFSARSSRRRQTAVSSDYFSDTVEYLDRTPMPEKAESRPPSSLRIWRRKYREFLKRPAESRSLLDGYGLILFWLRIHGAALSPADTTLEILNKALTCMPQSPFAQVTEGYNQIRYGELPLREGDYDSLLQTLQILAQTK